jgi:oligosaccharide repeat unit polymerase
MLTYPVILLAFVVLALLARQVEGSWIAPATIWPVAWGAYSAGTLALVGQTPHLAPALLWIVLNCAVFLGAAVFSRAMRQSRSVRIAVPAASERFPWLGRITFVLSVAGFLALFGATRAAGFSPADLLSLPSLARIAVASRATFEFGGRQQDVVARLLLVLAYTGAPFGGMYFRIGHGAARKAVALAPLVALIFIGFVSGSRMGVLFGGSFWLAAYVSGSLLATSGDRRVGTRMFFLVGVLALVLIAGGSAAVQFVRYFAGNERTVARIVAEPFGFLAAFGQWFESNGIRGSGLTAGFYTFERLGRMLGADFPPVMAIDVGFTSSNTDTVFRGLIEDFGSAGSLVIVGAAGFLASVAYRRVVTGHTTWLAALTLTYAFLFTSMALSPFAYMGPAIAGAAFVMYVVFATRPRGAARAIFAGLSSRPLPDRIGA